jgi:hypothetical protein
MTDVRLEDLAPGEGWNDGSSEWDTGPVRSVERAEAIERATSSRIFFVRAVARALLAVDAALVPTRRRTRQTLHALLWLAATLATPVTLPLRGVARLVSRSPRTVDGDATQPSVPAPVPNARVLERTVPTATVAETTVPDAVVSAAVVPAPPAAPVVSAPPVAPARPVRPARQSAGAPRTAVLQRLVLRARVLGVPALVRAVLADVTWPGRALVPSQPATGAVATLHRLPASLGDLRRAPATLAKVALASSMTISILGGSAAAAIHASSGAPAGGGPVRVALPGHGSTLVWTARPLAAGEGATSHRALASSANGQSLAGASAIPPGTAAAAPIGPPVVPTVKAGLPPGKGMWLYQPDQVEGGNVAAIISKATATGLHYLYVHLGSGTDGFNAQSFLNQVLPAAHAANIRVYGWDFPFFTPPEADVNRAMAEITYRTPSGDRIDGFAPDIEPEPGVNIGGAGTYAGELRNAVGPGYPIIGVVPRPNGSGYPYSAVLSHFDAVAVMDYWLDAEPGADIAKADANLAGQNVAMIPIGQAYNGAENGVPGSPSGAAISRFIQVAEQTGAVGVSFWSWQDTTPEEWDAIRNAPQFSLPTFPASMTSGQVRTWQAVLNSLGFPIWPTGVWDQQSVAAVSNYQRAAHLPVTGVVDDATKAVILTPFPPPIQPARPPPPAPPPAPAPSAAPVPAPPPATTTTLLPNPNPLLPYLSAPQGMGTPTSAPASH